MSAVSYNSIILPYPIHTAFRQEVIYDDMGQTDWHLTKFDIQLDAVLNLNYMSEIAPQYLVAPAFTGQPTTNTADLMKLIRTDLLKPRKTLSVKINGRELIPVTQAGNRGTVDAKNGPQPQSCSILELTNETFLISYHIIAHYWENYNNTSFPYPDTVANYAGNNVLYNRWTETVEIDNCMFSKRIREGKYMIRSDNIDGRLADEMRSSMAVVGVPQGFVREYSTYKVSPDGLAIEYKVSDKEIFKMPPRPAFEATGHYTWSTVRLGAVQYAESYVRLRGCKDRYISPQNELMNVAVGLSARKHRLNNNGGRLESAKVKVDMYDNVVECYMRSMITPDTSTFGPMATHRRWLNNSCTTPFSEDGAPQPVYWDRGTASLLLQAAAYFDPSLRNNSLDRGEVGYLEGKRVTTKNSQMSAGLEPGRAGRNLES